MKRPKISVIIPVYNCQAFLKKCLDSIVNQTYTNLEIIIVNDGSTDNSGAMIDEYAKSDKRIKTFNKSNGGIGSAYNLALNHVTGDYLTFVDSDDWAELNLYEELVSILFDINADVVSFGKKYVDSKGKFIKHNSRADSVLECNHKILKFHFETMKHPGLGRLWKNELFQNITIFDQNIGIDEMLTPQLLAKCDRAVYTSKVLYNVLVRDDSVCRSAYNEKKIRDTIKVHQFLRGFMENEIPEYAALMHEKHFGVAAGMYRFSLENQNIVEKKVKDLAKNEFLVTYRKTRKYNSFNGKPLKIRIIFILLVLFPHFFKVFKIGGE